jgi:hypothetical protein
VKDTLTGISTRIQGSSMDDLSRENLMERITRLNKNDTAA